MQCRITTEDPSADFRPDTGKITTYRSPGGAGIRLDGGTVNQGAQISPYFDSMLAKMTTRGRNFETAVARARRGLAEFRIRGSVDQYLVPASGRWKTLISLPEMSQRRLFKNGPIF